MWGKYWLRVSLLVLFKYESIFKGFKAYEPGAYATRHAMVIKMISSLHLMTLAKMKHELLKRNVCRSTSWLW